MPSGEIHEYYRKKGRLAIYPTAVLVSVMTSTLPLKVHGNVLIGVGMFVGYEIGRYVTPDWDIMGTTSSEGWMVNEIPVLGHLLFGLSSAYGSAFRRHHRSFATHFPFVSTLGRYLLIFWWIWWQLYIAQQDWAWLVFIFIGAYIGTSLADGIHWALDNWYNPTGE